MPNLNLKTTARKAGRFVKKNSPLIMTCMSVVGFIGTVVLAVKATGPALLDIADMEFEKEQSGEKITTFDYIKTGAKHYVPAAITGVATIGCIVGSEVINQKRIASITAAYTMTESALRAYKEEAKEAIGPKKFAALEDKIAEKKLASNPMTESNKPANADMCYDAPRMLCYDANSGRYFFSNADNLKKAVNNLNSRINDETFAVLNDFYTDPWVGLKTTEIGEYMGWQDPVELRLTYHQSTGADDQDCVVVNFSVDPNYDWRNHF